MSRLKDSFFACCDGSLPLANALNFASARMRHRLRKIMVRSVRDIDYLAFDDERLDAASDRQMASRTKESLWVTYAFYILPFALGTEAHGGVRLPRHDVRKPTAI